MAPPGPTRAELAAAAGGRVPDVVAPGLRVLFCGVNPGLWSAAVGHHFARPGNRFWRALHLAGFTPRVLDPSEDGDLPRYGLGLTNLVERATSGAAELAAAELRAGAGRLAGRAGEGHPAGVAVLGVGAWRIVSGTAAARVGPQPDRIGGAGVWLLPNPSGLNAHWQLGDLAAAFAELRRATLGG
jgi:TDG/mug DNA glycosylase family protein